MTARERVLTEIAERYSDLIEPLNGRSGILGDGDSVALMPPTYTSTVREFERLARLMREDHHSPLVRLATGEKVSVRQLRWHLSEYHLNAQRVIRHRPIAPKGKHGKRLRLLNQDGKVATRPELVTLRNEKARQDLAHQAIVWMAEHWGLVTEPMLPRELLAAA